MSLKINIKKKLNNFYLNVSINTNCKRIGILGASGCGKSMTLKAIAGIETPDEGLVESNDKILYQCTGRRPEINLKPQKRKIGYLFQNYALFPTMTVEKNIAAGLKGNSTDKNARVKEMIAKFHLEGLEQQYPHELSGGQQQRVALARIMAYEPEVILLDEPFSALDGFLKERLQQELMRMLEDYAGTVVLVSHNRDEIYQFSDELVVMADGQVVCQGKTKEIFANPTYMEAARLTGCKNIVRAEKIDSYSLKIKDWGINLHFEQELEEEIHYIGIRAHDFIPLWKGVDERQCVGKLPAHVLSMAELPFERKYFLRSEYPDQEICWFVQRDQYKELNDKGIPEYLGVPESKLLLLK